MRVREEAIRAAKGTGVKVTTACVTRLFQINDERPGRDLASERLKTDGAGSSFGEELL